MTVLPETKTRCPELAAFLEACCEAPLRFDGDHPNQHSSHNHIHLWALEWWADHHAWITLDYRVRFVAEILNAWRGRLKGHAPYQADGYRLYLYEDMAPTLSVVAQTPFGFPYPGTPRFVGTATDIMTLYTGRSWRAQFEAGAQIPSAAEILRQVDKAAGSISKPTAQALGIGVGALRVLIEQMGLQSEVNALRKRYKRRPAQFRDEDSLHSYRIYEQVLPAGFD